MVLQCKLRQQTQNRKTIAKRQQIANCQLFAFHLQLARVAIKSRLQFYKFCETQQKSAKQFSINSRRKPKQKALEKRKKNPKINSTNLQSIFEHFNQFSTRKSFAFCFSLFAFGFRFSFFRQTNAKQKLPTKAKLLPKFKYLIILRFLFWLSFFFRCFLGCSCSRFCRSLVLFESRELPFRRVQVLRVYCLAIWRLFVAATKAHSLFAFVVRNALFAAQGKSAKQTQIRVHFKNAKATKAPV